MKRTLYIAAGFCAVVYIAAVSAYTVWSYESRKKMILREIDQKLLMAAGSLKYILPGDFHDRATGPDSISYREELRNRSIINSFNSENGFKWTYTLAEERGNFYFSAPSVSDEEAGERKSWYFYPYADIPQEFIDAYRDLHPRFVNYTDQWGTFRSVALPQVSPGGRVYLSCADYEIGYVNSILRKNLVTSIFSAFYFIVFSLPFVLVFRSFYRSYTDNLKVINDELSLHKSGLEKLVEERTSELTAAYEKLQKELHAREEAEETLRGEKEKLETALSDVRTLSGLIPICSSCKKIRDDRGYWNQLEKFIQKHSTATFSHSICPECLKRLYPDLADDN